MNYLALLSVCATYAPGLFYVYNLSDWFHKERSHIKNTVAQPKSRPLFG